METSIQLRVTLPIKIIKKRKWFLASCPILDIYSQGETEKKARHNLKDALSLFFISCFERGTLNTVLKDSGVKVVDLSQRKPPPLPRKDFVSVPIPFLVDQANQQSTWHVTHIGDPLENT